MNRIPPRRRAARSGGQTRGQEPKARKTQQSKQSKPGDTQRPVQGASRPSTYPSPQPGRGVITLLIGGMVGTILVGLLVLGLLLGAPASSVSPGTGLAAQPGATSPVGQGASTTPTPDLGSGPSGPGTPMPEEGKDHVEEGTVISYEAYPPSSGTHYGSTGEYGFAEGEVPEGKLIHNLEHGTIVLYYKPRLPEATMQSLQDVYTSLPPAKYGKVKLVIALYPRLQTPMALVAWGRMLPLSDFDFEQIRAFYAAWVDRGPEDVP